ncbi:unnamed protein product [Urochloa decumbens]|uniref:F-box domain-containing protein n=1 Tax=Urochloa decumbens TaxID=240449 RepID=A0ABC9GBN8_9POAL
MAPPRPPPELIDDAVAEILLRIPPDEPADLFRASLVCKPWLRIASDAAFLRRYRAFHRGAPLLGFFYCVGSRSSSPTFVPTTAASPLPRAGYDDNDDEEWCWYARDCRHGRVLLRKSAWTFVVWDPITGHREELPKLDILYMSYSVSAVVLCAVAGCNHCDCHGGPFLVVCVGRDEEDADIAIRACVYSSEAHAWSTPDSTQLNCGYTFDRKRAAVIGDEIYCTIDVGSKVLKYDFVKHCFSLINLPCVYRKDSILMQNNDGSLGLAGVRGSTLYLWSRMVNQEGITEWVQKRAIKLKKILRKADDIGFAEGVGVFVMRTSVGAFTFELKSGQLRKISERRDYWTLLPFISFFTPDHVCV